MSDEMSTTDQTDRPTDLLSLTEAAKVLSVPVDTLRWYCRKGEIGTKVGSQWVVNRRDLEAFKRRPRGNPDLLNRDVKKDGTYEHESKDARS